MSIYRSHQDMGRMKIEPYEGMWDFDGSCAPREDAYRGVYSSQQTFTLGLFQWERARSGKHLKRGKVQKRVSGRCFGDDVKRAHDDARAICAERNAARPSDEGGDRG